MYNPRATFEFEIPALRRATAVRVSIHRIISTHINGFIYDARVRLTHLNMKFQRSVTVVPLEVHSTLEFELQLSVNYVILIFLLPVISHAYNTPHWFKLVVVYTVVSLSNYITLHLYILVLYLLSLIRSLLITLYWTLFKTSEKKFALGNLILRELTLLLRTCSMPVNF